MPLRTTYPCVRCLRQARCAWLLRDLRNAVAEARLRGMPEDMMPDIVVDCVQQFVPASLVKRGDKVPDNPDGSAA